MTRRSKYSGSDTHSLTKKKKKRRNTTKPIMFHNLENRRKIRKSCNESEMIVFLIIISRGKNRGEGGNASAYRYQTRQIRAPDIVF